MLSPTMVVVDKINEYILSLLPNNSTTYHTSDSISTDVGSKIKESIFKKPSRIFQQNIHKKSQIQNPLIKFIAFLCQSILMRNPTSEDKCTQPKNEINHVGSRNTLLIGVFEVI